MGVCFDIYDVAQNGVNHKQAIKQDNVLRDLPLVFVLSRDKYKETEPKAQGNEIPKYQI